MRKPLWSPYAERIQNSNITRFIDFINKRYTKHFISYSDLYDWSVSDIADFWASLWDFLEIKASKPYETVVDDLEKFPGARWFMGAELNFAENLLRYRDEKTAFVFKRETEAPVSITYEELHREVGRVATFLKAQEVGIGDRVVAYMPNMTETAVAMLAATSLGAVWASCGSELGVQAVIDRFSQIEPKVLFAVDGYFYKNKPFSLLSDVKTIVETVPSIQKVIIVPCITDKPNISDIPGTSLYRDLPSIGKDTEITFEQVPADHPVYIMFSSGTTGKPKCMVQSVAGILVNQMKELIIHADLKREDVITYMTAPSWMMWNWLICSLAVGSKIVLFDGNPGYPDMGTMWKLIQDEKITFFGTSATYINILKSQGFRPKDLFDLSSLKTIGQTGSPLSAEGFKYVYESIKDDVHFNSLAGGTDINGCFAIGSPILPVYAGELQSPALGMKIKAYDENGTSVLDKQGELVCEAPAPSMPLYFLNDQNYKRYTAAYFEVYQKVWRHGDYVEFHSDTGGVTFFGRSDAILKPSGVRIGTAEIYNIIDSFIEIEDSVAIGQNWDGDQRVLLFVKLAQGTALNDDLKEKIRKELRDKASPRHVPALILEAPDIPYTFNMKKVESAVTNIINGRQVTNRDALANPQSLDYFEKVYRDFTKVMAGHA
jgi:acetoacetyl-CoA synthetase